MNKVSLALLGKINKMYAEGNPEVFIAFNHAAMPYEPDTFQKDIHEQTNAPLKVSTFKEATGRDNYIWDSYKESLNHAETADSNWSAAQWQDFEQKVSRLTALEPQYKLYENKHLALKAEIEGVKASIEQINDDEEREEKEEKLKLLQNESRQQLIEWKTKGKKMEYELLANEILASEPEYPIQVINKYKEDLDAAEIGGSAAAGQMVYATEFSPSDFFEENGSGWINFDLDKDEINSMYRYALNTVFAEVKNEVQPNANDDELEIERISGELGTVQIKRSWLNKNFFHAGYWRLASGFEDEYLSDGAAKNPKGRMPAYVDKVIFIKKLDIELTPNSRTNKKTIEENQKNGTPIMFGNMLFKLPATKHISNIKSISKPIRLNKNIALKYRSAITTAQLSGINKLYIPSNFFKLKSSVVFSNQFTVGSPAIGTTSPVGGNPINITNTPIGAGGQFGRNNIILGGRGIGPATSFNSVNGQFTTNLDRLQGTHIGTVGHVGSVINHLRFGYKGKVKSEDGRAMAGVKLTFIDVVESKKRYTITTNNKGEYVAHLAAGSYKVEIDHPGYFRYFKRLQYKKGQALKVLKHDIILAKDQESELEDQFSFVCLGVLCQKLPKSPDANMNLTWD